MKRDFKVEKDLKYIVFFVCFVFVKSWKCSYPGHAFKVHSEPASTDEKTLRILLKIQAWYKSGQSGALITNLQIVLGQSPDAQNPA